MQLANMMTLDQTNLLVLEKNDSLISFQKKFVFDASERLFLTGNQHC